jgi:hypothetical protein
MQARIDFIDSYKNLNKLSSYNKFRKVEDSPSIAYLSQISKNRLYPQACGIIRRNGKEDDFNYSQFNLGDNYGLAIS